ncbi:MAG: hypothetical protein AB1Z98_01395 [Nannocystaceae bacterium]
MQPPAPEPAAIEPAVPPADAGNADDGADSDDIAEADDADDEPELLDIELDDGPLEADLDGDGRVEAIAWTCSEDKTEITIGKATLEATLGFADLIGCSAAVVDLDPGRRGVQLWLLADEHEEAGPDRNFVLGYRRGKIQTLWVEELDFSPTTDGSWTTESYECDEAQRLHRTTNTRWRLVDGKVMHEDTVQAKPLSAGETCDYDPAEP